MKKNSESGLQSIIPVFTYLIIKHIFVLYEKYLYNTFMYNTATNNIIVLSVLRTHRDSRPAQIISFYPSQNQRFQWGKELFHFQEIKYRELFCSLQISKQELLEVFDTPRAQQSTLMIYVWGPPSSAMGPGLEVRAFQVIDVSNHGKYPHLKDPTDYSPLFFF